MSKIQEVDLQSQVGEHIPGDPQRQARSLQSWPGRWHVAKRPKTIYHTVNLRDPNFRGLMLERLLSLG